MKYNFQPLVDQYCQAKSAAAADPSNKILIFRKKTANNKLVNTLLKAYEAHANSDDLFRKHKEQYLSYLGKKLADVSAKVCEEYDSSWSLLTWINGKLGFEKQIKPEILKELYKGFENTRPLDEVIKKDDSGQGIERSETIGDERPEVMDLILQNEPFEEIKNTVKNLENYTKTQQQEYRQNRQTVSPLEQWLNYLENDPDDFFKSKIFKDIQGNPCPECNEYLILQETILEDLKNLDIINLSKYYKWNERLDVIAEKFNVDKDNLKGRLQRSNSYKSSHKTIHDYVLGFGLTFGLDERFIRNLHKIIEAINNDPDNYLKNDHLKECKLCNSQWLAKNRLPYFVDTPKDFLELQMLLAQEDQKYYKLNPKKIEEHWLKRTLLRLGKLVFRFNHD